MAIKGKSKFDFESFPTEFINLMGFNKQKYSKEEALALWFSERMLDKNTPYIIEDAWVRYRYGMDDDGKTRSTWWHDWRDYGHRSVPIWSIREPFSWEQEAE